MKILRIFLLFILSANISVTYAMPGAYETGTPNLRALWHFDSGAFVDATGNHTLNTYGTPQIKDVISLDGMGRAVSGFTNTGALQSTTIGDSSNFTSEAWVKWDDAAQVPQTLTSMQVVMAKIKDTATIASQLSFVNGELKIELANGAGQIQSVAFNVGNVVVGQWYHVAFSIEKTDVDADGEDDVRVKLYWNDENNVKVNAEPVANEVFTNFTYRADGSLFRLGKRYNTSYDFFRGTIDEVRIVNAVHNNFETFQKGDLSLYRGKNSFFIGQSLQAFNLPDLTSCGFTRVHKVADVAFWDAETETRFPNENNIRQEARLLTNSQLYYLDIETMDTSYVDDPDGRVLAIQKLASIADWIHSERPGIRIGFYGIAPETKHYLGNPEGDANWKARNADFGNVAQHADVVFPVLYTFYNNNSAWKVMAEENLKEARKYGKPVYAMLWPMFHDKSTLVGIPLPADLWRLQLETAYKYADGIIIWSKSDSGEWSVFANPNDPTNWWYQTLDFLKDKKLAPAQPCPH